MNVSEGLNRLKLAWAVLCVVGAIAVLALLVIGDAPNLDRMFKGIAAVTWSLAVLPFLDWPVDAKVCVGIVGVWGGFAYAEGPGKWPEGLVIAVIFALLLYGVIWVFKGFFQRKRPSS